MRNRYIREDVKARLGGTIIRYKGRPVKCEAHESGKMTLFPLDGAEAIQNILPDDDDIDISSLSLGYVNIESGDYRCAVYLKREAHRQYRQGVDVSRLTMTPLCSDIFGPISSKVIEGKPLVDCVLNKYPSITEMIFKFNSQKFRSVALSKEVAAKRENDLLKVYVKDIEIGFIRLSEVGAKVKVVVPQTDTSTYAIFFLSEIKGWDISEGNGQ